VLSQDEISAFLADGYVAVRDAVPAAVAAACQEIIWSGLHQRGVLRDDPSTWTRPVIRIPCSEGGPFAEAGTSPLLQEACDQLIGAGRWWRRADPPAPWLASGRPPEPETPGWTYSATKGALASMTRSWAAESEPAAG
jgi:NAD(P)-dependent dehydrogenase (short-subunit alcohol dehydrogenase family)